MTKTIAQEVAMPKALPYLRILPLVVAGFLPLLLFVSISGCTVSAARPLLRKNCLRYKLFCLLIRQPLIPNM